MIDTTTKLNIKTLSDSTGLDDTEPFKTVLGVLRGKPGARIAYVAEATKASKRTTRNRLYRLVVDGYVRCERVFNIPLFYIAEAEP